jgi:predicted kinase
VTPALIVVTGAPGSGKTTIAVPLATRLRLPLIAKDELKEALWEQLGPGDRDRFLAYGRATYPLMLLVARLILRSGGSAIVEANFRPDFAAADLEALREETAFRLVQILCRADPDACLARYRERAETDARHPMHRVGGAESEAGVERGLRDGLWEHPIPLDGKVFTVDTNQPVDVDALADAVQAALTEA